MTTAVVVALTIVAGLVGWLAICVLDAIRSADITKTGDRDVEH